uniref:HIRAN domain-containing protein n=1 Tax=Amphimedon queenslandica TaxID=400682 RepID=A0A1X7V2F0_AMPQE
MARSFTFQSMIRGYHVYKDSWIPEEGETLDCIREMTNLHDPYAASVMKNGKAVGHVPRKNSASCSVNLQSGSIHCIVTGKRYSCDLPQGGLEIPSILVFTGDVDKTHKVEKILKKIYSEADDEVVAKEEEETLVKNELGIGKDSKKRKVDDKNDESDSNSHHWLQIDKLILCTTDRLVIKKRDELNDLHVIATQFILKMQFPLLICGLCATCKILRDPPKKWVQ